MLNDLSHRDLRHRWFCIIAIIARNWTKFGVAGTSEDVCEVMNALKDKGRSELISLLFVLICVL